MASENKMKLQHLEGDTGQQMATLDSRTKSIIDDLKNTLNMYQANSDAEREKLEARLLSNMERISAAKDSLIVRTKINGWMINACLIICMLHYKLIDCSISWILPVIIMIMLHAVVGKSWKKGWREPLCDRKQNSKVGWSNTRGEGQNSRYRTCKSCLFGL